MTKFKNNQILLNIISHIFLLTSEQKSLIKVRIAYPSATPRIATPALGKPEKIRMYKHPSLFCTTVGDDGKKSFLNLAALGVRRPRKTFGHLRRRHVYQALGLHHLRVRQDPPRPRPQRQFSLLRAHR